MTRTPLLLALIAAAALAGCNNDTPTVIAGPEADPANKAPATNTPVMLPPSIVASHSYRCRDNSIVQIDWLSDNKSANFRTADRPAPVNLTAPEPGQSMTAEGYSLTGAPEAPTINLTRPDKGAQSCKR